MLPVSIRLYPILAAIVLAIVFGILTAMQSFGPRKAAFRFYTTILVGCIFLWSALTNIVELRRLPRISAEGVVQNLRKTNGKHAHSSFKVVESDHHHLNYLLMDYTGGNLQDGQFVRVEYVGVRGTITHFHVLTGSHEGWDRTEGDGTVGSCFGVALSLFVYWIAYKSRKKYPDGNVPGRYGTRRTPVIDESSMLQFSPETKAIYHGDRV